MMEVEMEMEMEMEMEIEIEIEIEMEVEVEVGILYQSYRNMHFVVWLAVYGTARGLSFSLG